MRIILTGDEAKEYLELSKRPEVSEVFRVLGSLVDTTACKTYNNLEQRWAKHECYRDAVNTLCNSQGMELSVPRTAAECAARIYLTRASLQEVFDAARAKLK